MLLNADDRPESLSSYRYSGLVMMDGNPSFASARSKYYYRDLARRRDRGRFRTQTSRLQQHRFRIWNIRPLISLFSYCDASQAATSIKPRQ